MIDLLKNYKELKNSSGYTKSIRYYLAKKKLDVVLESYRHYSSSGFSWINKLSRSSSRRHRAANWKQPSNSASI